MTKKVTPTESGIYKEVHEYLQRYPMTLAWRIKQHSKVMEKHLNEDYGEEDKKYRYADKEYDIRKFDYAQSKILIASHHFNAVYHVIDQFNIHHILEHTDRCDKQACPYGKNCRNNLTFGKAGNKCIHGNQCYTKKQ